MTTTTVMKIEPIYEQLVEDFAHARRGRCWWIDDGPGMEKCLKCGATDWTYFED
jgi:hypothetical protein